VTDVKYARFRTADSTVGVGQVADGVVRSLYGDHAVDDVDLLPPSEPSKIVCVGLNYRDHAEELGMELPEEPLLFFKPPSAATGHLAEIVYPPECEQLDYEAELAVVIGRRTVRVDVERALDHVAGYTVGNDVTARNFQTPGSQWTRAKGFDTFAPLGPYLVRDLDPDRLAIECRVNGELRQKSNTDQMVFGVAELVAFTSSIMTLEAGDVIMTGTPSGVGSVEVGDTVEVAIEGLGKLRNTVITATP
jgi:2-keto-4-pentenoate hydratase/2-oxohepta-3-ene-1,7-dioic acid hydratase in catechol pathway